MSSHVVDMIDGRAGEDEGSAWRNLAAISALFAATVSRLCRAKRLLILLVLYLLPSVIVLFARSQGETMEVERADFFLMLNLLPNAIVPFTALLLASGLIQDEVEEQTLTYLIVRPLPRALIYVTKLVAAIVVTSLAASVCTFINELVIHGSDAATRDTALQRAAVLSGLYALSLCAYCALFGLLGLSFRRALPIGVIYIIVFEGMFANFDFIIRKATVMNSFRNLTLNLLPVSKTERRGMMEVWSTQAANIPSVTESIATLAITALLAAALGAWIFSQREFRMKTPESS